MPVPKRKTTVRFRREPCRNAFGGSDQDHQKEHFPKQQNALPNGLICLKGGELEHETMPFKHKTVIHSLSENFEEEFFETKKVVYSQI